MMNKQLLIFLIRHGRTEWNKKEVFRGHLDISLDEVGKAQAEATGRVLQEVNLGIIYSSPLTRALQTAHIIKKFCPRHARLAKRVGKPLGIAIIYEDICATLIERIEEGGKITNPGKGCPVCRFAKEVEEHYLKTFLENFSSDDFQDRYKKGFGLCMHHFVTVYLRLPGQREKEVLKNYQLHMLNEHLSRLREFIRKHDYRFSNEGFGKEANSWNSIVDKIIGEGD